MINQVIRQIKLSKMQYTKWIYGIRGSLQSKCLISMIYINTVNIQKAVVSRQFLINSMREDQMQQGRQNDKMKIEYKCQQIDSNQKMVKLRLLLILVFNNYNNKIKRQIELKSCESRKDSNISNTNETICQHEWKHWTILQ